MMYASHRAIVAALISVGVVLAAPQARADTWQVTVINSLNPLPVGNDQVNDIHLTFSGTGGMVTNPAAVLPLLTTFPSPQPANGMDAVFPTISNGSLVRARFDLPAGFTPIYESGNWTFNGVNRGNISANDVILVSVPAPGALAVVGVGLLGACRRRRTG